MQSYKITWSFTCRVGWEREKKSRKCIAFKRELSNSPPLLRRRARPWGAGRPALDAARYLHFLTWLLWRIYSYVLPRNRVRHSKPTDNLLQFITRHVLSDFGSRWGLGARTKRRVAPRAGVSGMQRLLAVPTSTYCGEYLQRPARCNKTSHVIYTFVCNLY